MKKFIYFLLCVLFSEFSYGNSCNEEIGIIEKFNHYSNYKNKKLEVCIHIINENNYTLFIFNNEEKVVLSNLTKNLSAKIQDISINPIENGFLLVLNIGDNYTRTISLKFTTQDFVKLDEISTYISRNSKMIEEYKRIVYQYNNTKIEDLDLEKILNDDF